MFQVSVALNAQLDPGCSAKERKRRLMKVAHKIEYWQRKAAKAARCHRKRRLKLLKKLGIRISLITKCFRN